MRSGGHNGYTMGAALLCGIAVVVSAHLLVKGGLQLKPAVRTVVVKGLVEREVKADEAIWTLRFRRASDDLKDAHSQINTDRETTVAFLRKQGFADDEIIPQPTRTFDKRAREYGSNQGGDEFRYVVMSLLLVRSPNVDLVTKTLGATDELLSAGVVLDAHEEGSANPRYVLTTFNDLRPQLFAEATKNARTMAQQFANDAGTRIGKIRSANQGVIQIFGSDGNDESAPYSPTSTPVKRIRVVSTFEFELLD